MATLTIKKKNNTRPGSKPGAGDAPAERRGPLRGKGVSRPRQTLQQAQAEREERQAAFEKRRADEGGFAARGPSHGPGRDAPRQGGPRDDTRGRSFQEERRPWPDRPDRPGRPGPRDERNETGGRGFAPERREPFRPGGAAGFNAGRDARDEAPRRPRPAPGYAQERFEPPREPAPRAPRQDQRRATGARPPRDPNEARYERPRASEERLGEGERLSKRMGVLGMASRREADEWIAAGWVRVDGRLAVLGQRVGPDARIEIDPKAGKEQAQRVTILIHKPIGYVSGQAEDGYEPASVLIKSSKQWQEDPSGIKFHIGHTRGLAPAGRLDIDSTGLLVLTQDGRVAKALIGDDSKVEKEYLVRVEYVGINGVKSEDGKLPEEAIKLLNHGLTLDDVELKPAKVSWANEDQLRFVLREGRKRQIRRMCELVGLKVVGLKRVRIGRIPLGHLPVGEWRFLAAWERFD